MNSTNAQPDFRIADTRSFLSSSDLPVAFESLAEEERAGDWPQVWETVIEIREIDLSDLPDAPAEAARKALQVIDRAMETGPWRFLACEIHSPGRTPNALELGGRGPWKPIEAGQLAPVLELRARRMADLLGDAAPRPPSDRQREVWEALDGRALSAQEIADDIGSTEGSVRQLILEIRKSGRKIERVAGLGYVRPNAPPPS